MLGPVHMVKNQHKYVTLLQINVPMVMIVSPKLGMFIWQGDIYLTVRAFFWDEGPFIWQGGTIILQEGTFIMRRVTILLQIVRGTKLWSRVRTLRHGGEKLPNNLVFGMQICRNRWLFLLMCTGHRQKTTTTTIFLALHWEWLNLPIESNQARSCWYISILCTQEISNDGFCGSKILKCLVGEWLLRKSRF